jgi:hypothetical protein
VSSELSECHWKRLAQRFDLIPANVRLLQHFQKFAINYKDSVIRAAIITLELNSHWIIKAHLEYFISVVPITGVKN